MKKFFIIIIISLLIYFPSLFFGFSYFDDHVLILDNLNFIKNLANFFNVFKQEVFYNSSFYGSYYRPILTLSFMFDAQLSSASPFFYHLSNIVYHIIASILVFIFLKKIKVNEDISFFLSLFFAVHPVLVQAVSWLPGRNDSLLTIFTLLSFIFLIRYLEKREFLNLFFYLLFFAIALLTKETAILIPFFSIFFLFLFDNQKKSYLIELFVGWWLIGLFWLILRQRVLNNILYLGFTDIIKALIFNSPAILIYWGKVFFPFNLSVLPIIKDTSFIWSFLALMAFLVLIFFGKKIDKKKFIFGICWFILFLLPNFIMPNTSIIANFLEHRIYLSLVGLLVVFSSIELISNFLRAEKNKFYFFTVIFIMALINFFHQFNFKDRLTFWKSAIQSSPHSPLAHRNYGAMLYFEDKIKEAEKEYKKSLVLNSKEPMVHNNLGVIYMRKKNWLMAEKEFKKELETNPYYDNALYNLGLVYYNMNKKEKAEKLWQKTIQINPRYFSAYKSLIIYYQELGEKEKAEKYLLIYQQLNQ